MKTLKSMCLLFFQISLIAASSAFAPPICCAADPGPWPALTVVSDDTYPPYIFRDEQGKLQGIVIDQWNLWEKKTGTKVTVIGMDWGKAQKFMADGNADVIDTVFFTEERAQQYTFTKPYATLSVPVFFHRDISGITDVDSLKGFTIGVKEGDACIEVLRAHGITSLQPYKSYKQIVEAAADSRIKVFVIDEPPALYYLYKLQIESAFRHSAPLYVGQFHRAVKKGREDVLQVLEEGFAGISQPEYKQIEEKWKGSALRTYPEGLRYILHAAIAFAALVLILTFWNYSLRKRVSQRTSQLQQTLDALRIEEEKYRELVENANSIILRMDTEGVVSFFNEFAQHFFGYTEEEIVGRNVVGTIVPQLESTGRDLESLILDIASQPDRYANNVNENMRRDGERVWIAWTNKVIHDEDGRFVEILCIGNDITERKRTERALIDANQRLNDIIEFLPDATFVIDKDKKVIAWNRAIEQMTGVSKEEMIGQGDHAYTIPFYGEKRPHLLDLIGVNDEIIESQYRYVKRKGNILCAETFVPNVYGRRGAHVFATGAPLLDMHGNQTGAIESIRDISESKLKEEALKESQQQLANIINFLPDATFVIDKEGRVIAWNRAIEELTGIKAEEILGKGDYEYALPFYGERRPILIDLAFGPRKEVEEKYLTIRKEGNVVEGEVYVPGIKGEQAYLYGRASLLRDSNGDIVGAIESIRDITERMALMEAMARAEQKFRSIFENAMEGIFQTTLDGRMLSANPALARIFGYESPEDMMDSVTDLAQDLYVSPESRLNLLQLLEEQGAVQEYEVQFWRKDKSIVWAELNVRAERDENGRIVYLEGTVQDITERKALESQLIQAQKLEAIGTLAGGIAHDFNNILSAIIGYAEMAITDVSPASCAYRDVGQVLVAANRAKDLVKQILAFSRQEGTHQLIPLKVSSVVQEAIRLLRATLPSTIEMRQYLGNERGLVSADPTQIHQVLVNLCTNAAHAMETGGVLKIDVSDVEIGHDAKTIHPDLSSGPYLRLTVSDTGHGMDSATLERIFDPYFTTKKVGRGSGLGLAVVHGIIKRHGGAIEVQSKIGEGSVFHVYLPKIRQSSEETESQNVEISPPLRGSERVLFVDDEESLSELGQSLLKSLGYEVFRETSSIEALEFFRENSDQIDLVITDYTMPKMTGIDFARNLIQIRADVPIILCTGYSDSLQEDRLGSLGIRQLLMKPYSIGDLALVVRKALDSEDAC